ncbi:MAG: DUF2255 family protein [Pseudomonadales bacterium]|jgi:hypothetical protein|nr:DUF2255 family protein [Pseudomonadales bacterium]MDP6470030.1 DUF2255 family protein [Pseudomonadales bacterium]MDP6826930.1 DUF2255 family protein [Pseudomonadales bacterium]MDP6971028.1 DUF2255 family protein [Pseudomonadales bacterium]|tara:strand:- start:1213 stop:1686 length:474 start_codon:yes stop_codon:yes gene_type:complete
MPRWLTYVLVAFVVVSLGVALAAPIGPMPGIRLGGNSATAPARWSSATLPEEVHLATYAGTLPHVVIIWVVETDNRLYVIGAPDSTWVEGATRSPDVRLRIDENVYDMRATRIESSRQDVFQAAIDRYKDNYPEIIAGFPPIAEFSQGAALFELSRR